MSLDENLKSYIFNAECVDEITYEDLKEFREKGNLLTLEYPDAITHLLSRGYITQHTKPSYTFMPRTSQRKNMRLPAKKMGDYHITKKGISEYVKLRAFYGI